MVKNKRNLLYDKFEVIECLKEHTHSCVYLANHYYLGKKILLKTLHTQNLPDKDILQRFLDEAQIVAKLDHPNIIKILDFGIHENDFYISFEYFEGQNLRTLIQKQEIDDKQKIHLFNQLLQALTYAHDQHVIHQDIKPENILVDSNNTLKVADFGLAVVRSDEQQKFKSSVVGTPGYMAPEQILGEDFSPQSDIFSTGIVFWELFTGTNPVIGKDVSETFNNILKLNINNKNIKSDKIPDMVQAVLKKMLQRERKKRFTSCHEILELLPISTKQEIPSSPDHPPDRHQKSSRHLFLPIAIILLIFSILIITITLGINYKRNQSVKTQNDKSENSHPVKQGENNKANTKQNTENNKPEIPENFPDTYGNPERKPVQLYENAGETVIETRKEYTTEEKTGRLNIFCLPWAEVYINSELIETTPLKDDIELSPGIYELKLTHPNYPEYTQQFQIKSNDLLKISLNLDTLFGYLDCQVYPWGEIFIDGKSRGQTPMENPIILTEGRHLLNIVHPSNRLIEEFITITKQETVQFKLNFEDLVQN